MRRYFFYGTLTDPDVLGLVLGRSDLAEVARPATLPGYRRVRVEGETYPALVADPAGEVDGIVVEGLDDEDDRRIRYFEDYNFAIETCTVTDELGAEVEAMFCGATRNLTPLDRAWVYTEWAVEEKAKFLEVARAYMACYGQADEEEADAIWLEAMRRVYGR